MSLQESLDQDLAIARQADPNHCSKCGRYLDRWYYGFPLPLCTFCIHGDHAATAGKGNGNA